MGFLGLFLAETLQRQNGLKNVLAGLVNLVAAIVFVVTTHIDWAAAGLIAVGVDLGGLLGARIGRRLSPAVLRAIIVVVGDRGDRQAVGLACRGPGPPVGAARAVYFRAPGPPVGAARTAATLLARGSRR